jgi:uncharacterized protein (DUF362 family)
MANSNVIIRSVKAMALADIVRYVFQACDYQRLIPTDAKVVVKVNLSTPYADMAFASNTSPELLDEVCALLRTRTKNVWVGESNGMRYDTEDAFEVSGYYPILEKHDVKPINFTKDEWVEVGDPLITGWGISKTLLDADVFISLPVLKTHATTVFTGTLKNQFGCYPQHNRILLHPNLDKVIVLINEILKPKLAIMDAITAMEGRGPINGKPRRMDLVLASSDPVALDATAMRLVGLDPYSCKHAVMACQRKLGHIDDQLIDVDGDFAEFQTDFEPAERDLPIKMLGAISHSKFLTEKLILNPESFYPLRSAAIVFRSIRDFLLGKLRLKNVAD